MNIKKIERQCLDFLSDVSSFILDTYLEEGGKMDNWNLKGMAQAVKQQFGFALPSSVSVGEKVIDWDETPKEGSAGDGQKTGISSEPIVSLLKSEVKKHYDQKKRRAGEHFQEVAQFILLNTLDARWKEHLENIDHLKEGINLRAYAQKDPLVEYKKESFALFEQMSLQVASESMEKLFKVQIQVNEPADYSPHQSLNEEEWDYDRPQVKLSLPSEGEASQASMSMPDGGRRAGVRPGSASSQPPQLNRAQRRRQKLKQKKLKI